MRTWVFSYAPSQHLVSFITVSPGFMDSSCGVSDSSALYYASYVILISCILSYCRLPKFDYLCKLTTITGWWQVTDYSYPEKAPWKSLVVTCRNIFFLFLWKSSFQVSGKDCRPLQAQDKKAFPQKVGVAPRLNAPHRLLKGRRPAFSVLVSNLTLDVPRDPCLPSDSALLLCCQGKSSLASPEANLTLTILYLRSPLPRWHLVVSSLK